MLRVGSHEVAWIWDRRPAPAAPPTPSPSPGRDEEVCTVEDMAKMGGEEPGMNALPKAIGVAATADMGVTTEVRPLGAAAAGGGEVGLALE